MTASAEGGRPGAAPSADEVLPIVAQLAAFLLRGAGLRDEGGDPRLGRLRADPRFAGPLARAARSSSTLAALPLDAGFVGRLHDRPTSRLCALLVCRPWDEVDRAALLVSSAVRHRDIVAVVLKADRERLRDALGDDAVQVVTHEALLLHGPLVELGADPAFRAADPASDVRERFLATGRQVFARFLALVEPSLVEAGTARWFAGDAVRADLRGMTERHCDHVVRLLRRRMPAWSTLTV